MLAFYFVALLNFIAGEFCNLRVRGTLQSAGDLNQFGRGHIFAQRILAGPGHFTLHFNRRRIDALNRFVDKHAILRLQ